MEVRTQDTPTRPARSARWLSPRRAAGWVLALAAVALLWRMPAARGQAHVTALSSDDRAQSQYQATATVHMNAGQLSSSTVVPIPFGTRWVIEYVSIHGNLPQNQNFVPHIWYRVLDTPVPFLQHNLLAGARGVFRNGIAFWHDSEMVRIYADPSASQVLGGGLLVQSERNASAGAADIAFTLTGYLTPGP